MGARIHPGAVANLLVASSASHGYGLEPIPAVPRRAEAIGMENEATCEQRRLLAAVAAALLGNQGSPVWSRTAEMLLLSSQETQRHHRRAATELSRILGDDLSER